MARQDAEENIVAAVTDREGDKYSLLENALEQARFFDVLEKAWRESGKARHEFRIAIKPNLSMLLRRSDVGTYTDPFLVTHLVRLLLKKGYSRLAVVESQNLYGNWFGNRSVIQVAARAGYLDESIIESYQNENERYMRVMGGDVDTLVPLVDLSRNTVLHDFGEPVGKVELGRAWIEADFRINFAKMKTHFYSYYSLAIKNVYGCLPKQDKVRSYHCKRVVGPWTALLIKRFPVHFSIVDGYTSADGWFGVKMKAICKKTYTIIAGADIMAVDHCGAGLIGVAPRKSTMYRNLQKLIPPEPYKMVGNAEPFRGWRNSPGLMAQVCRLIESYAHIMDFFGSIATGGHDECFPVTLYEGKFFRKILYYLFLPINILLDAGLIRLRLREMFFLRTLKKYKQWLPLITDTDFVLTRLMFLGKSEIEKLIALLEQDDISNMRCSGHYMIGSGCEIPLPLPLSTSNIAMAEILSHVHKNNMDKNKLAEEFRTLPNLCPDLFNSKLGYPYCYS